MWWSYTFFGGQPLGDRRVVTIVYRDTGIQTVVAILGYVAKQAEDRKLLAYTTSVEPIAAIHGGPHVLVPFVIEDGGRLGAHALALLQALAIVAIEPLHTASMSFFLPLLPPIGPHVGNNACPHGFTLPLHKAFVP